MRNVLKCFGAMSLVLLLLAMDGSSSSAQAQYNPGPGFKVSWALNPRADGNFRPVEYFGSSKVEVGMDFDRDGRREILFATDETLAPGGPSTGFLDIYLYEATGNDQYSHVWHYTTTELCNSLPALTYGDIDKDGKWEIYFGAPTVAPSTNKLLIFEQDASGGFPANPTLIYDCGRAGALDFRPSGLKLDDVDGDGKIELVIQSRTANRRELVVSSLVGNDFDDFASFNIEFEAGNDVLGGGGTYDVEVVDYDGDGKKEIWYNTWDNWSMAVFEAADTNAYALQVDLNEIFPVNDPGSFNRHKLLFANVDADAGLEAWFPMMDGVLYFLDDNADVATLTGTNFTRVGTYDPSVAARGGDLGDIDRDGRFDIIANAGSDEKIYRIEYLGIGSPKDSSSYEWTKILDSTGDPRDWWYPLRISPVDLDGDGLREVVITNHDASNAAQPLILVLEYDPTTADKLAEGWEIQNKISYTGVDALLARSGNGVNVNARTVVGGMDLDKDGKSELILAEYGSAGVRVFEYDVASDVFEQVWTSPPDTAAGVNRRYGSNPRYVTTGDLDGDGKSEIYFSLASTPTGVRVFEWDGVIGSDNYGTTYSSIVSVEIDTCCGTAPNNHRADVEAMNIVDVDGDGKQELLLPVTRATFDQLRGFMIVSVDGDIEHNSGGSFETWKAEYHVRRVGYGGGLPVEALPADLDGDGTYEIVCNTWNFFNFFNLDVTGPDSYQAPDPTSPTRNLQATAPLDHVALFGGDVADIDGDGDDEVFYPNFQTGDLWVVDYKSGDDVLSIDGSHVVKIGSNVGQLHASIFDVDKNGRPNIVVGTFPTGYPRAITSTEFIGADPRNPADYETRVIYAGEPDLFYSMTVRDSAGVMTTTTTPSSGYFPSKTQVHFNGSPIDFDGDGDYELLASFQGSQDSLTTTTYKWNGSGYDTLITKIKNPKDWAVVRLEFTGTGTAVEQRDVTFITPNDYVLEQNYPNPFNPTTTIRYSLPINKRVSLRIYDMMGRVVRTLVDDQVQSAGSYKVQWDGRNQHGTRVSSGVYLYSLEFGNFKKTKSMTLLK